MGRRGRQARLRRRTLIHQRDPGGEERIRRAGLLTIRAVHSVIFWAELGSIVWLVVTGLIGRRDRSVAVAAVLVGVESVVFIANDGVCPLTPLAERFGASSGSVSDIWLPDVIARTIPYWTVPLVVLGTLLHVRGLFASRRAGQAR